MKYLKISFILVALFSVQVILAQEEVKKPAEVFDLYFRGLVNMDEGAVAELNDYLRPTVKGSDTYNQLNKQMVLDKVLEASESFIDQNFSKKIKDNVKSSAREFFMTMFQNFWDSSYKIKEVKIVDNPFIKGEKIAEVYYTFSFKKPNLDVQKTLNSYQNKSPESLTSEDVNKVFKTLTEAYRTKAIEVTVDQRVELNQRKFDSKIYYIGDGIYKTMYGALKDVYFAE
ncbi:hypothetical protein [Soonwooa sp.]|uniref:hypothetical protein n=1 Tax=Soonwooa sp. TaxID=1938592 RepID=UPI002619DE1E|nr:hypothetical protein [Soonwooa sp.]